jgi:hypothetical protein
MQKHSVVPYDVQCPGEKNLYLTRCVRCRGIKTYQNIVLLIVFLKGISSISMSKSAVLQLSVKTC